MSLMPSAYRYSPSVMKRIFIIGSPRCGNTLMREYLIRTGKVYMSQSGPPAPTLDLLAMIWASVKEHSVETRYSKNEFGNQHDIVRETMKKMPDLRYCYPHIREVDFNRWCRGMIDEMCDPIRLPRFQYRGFQDVVSGTDLHTFADMCGQLYERDQWYVVSTVREPEGHIRSLINAPWWRYEEERSDDERLTEFGLRMLAKWRQKLEATIKAKNNHPHNVAVVRYDRIPEDNKAALEKVGLKWTPSHDILAKEPKINPSEIKREIPSKLMDAIREVDPSVWQNT